MKIRIHYNKRATDGNIWSIITSKACYHVKNLDIRVPTRSEHKPEKKHNPRAFITAEAEKLNINKAGLCIIQ